MDGSEVHVIIFIPLAIIFMIGFIIELLDN